MISIIMPVYNSEKYLRIMLDSILAQTYNDWEMILVDDGSTDHSLDICKEYENRDRRIKVIHQSNKGPGIARNVGISNAKGEYIYFADSDDWMDNDMLENLLSAMCKYDADIVASNYWEEYIDKTILIKRIEEGVHVYNKSDSIKLIFTNKIFSCLESMLFKRSVLVETFPTDRLYEDYIILGKWIFHINRMVTIGQAYYHYRQHHISLSHKQDKLSVKKNVLQAFLQRWHYTERTDIFNKERDFFIREYVSFMIVNARDIIRASVSYKDSKELIEEYSFCMKQINAKGMKFSKKMEFRKWLLTRHPYFFAHLMRLTALFSKGYKRNNKKDSIQYVLYDN